MLIGEGVAGLLVELPKNEAREEVLCSSWEWYPYALGLANHLIVGLEFAFELDSIREAAELQLIGMREHVEYRHVYW